MPAFKPFLQAQLDELAVQHQLRRRAVSQIQADGSCIRDGKRYTHFASNDYFGLSLHPEVLAALKQPRTALGAGASALVSGYSEELAALEDALARFKQTEAALVFPSGYAANIGAIGALMGPEDLIIADKYAHACMLDGARLSGAKLLRFRHNDVGHLEVLLKKRLSYRHCLILTETVFSMGGDRAPLPVLRELADAYDCWLLTDDAHGLGIVPTFAAEIQVGTLSKGLGSLGGYVCGSQLLIDWLINHARSYIFSTALPPALAAAAHRALELLRHDSARCAKPLLLAQQFTEALGLPEPESPIVPLIIGENARALAASAALAEAGFWVPAIRPPTVPPGQARLRFSFTALHSQQQVEALIEEIRHHGWHERVNH